MLNEKILALKQEQVLLQIKLDRLKSKLYLKTLCIEVGLAAMAAGVYLLFQQDVFNRKLLAFAFVLPGIFLCLAGFLKRSTTLSEKRKMKTRIDELDAIVLKEEQSDEGFGLPRRYRHRFK